MIAPASCTFISSAAPAEPGDPALYVRRDFDVTTGLRRATLFVTGLGIVEPWLNGERIGSEVLAPGWTSYRHRLHVSQHDVTDALVEGANTVGAIVGQGWAVGALTWENRARNYADRPAVLVEIELEFADRVEVLRSDTTFRTGVGAVGAHGIYEGETYDARAEPKGWAQPGFDDSGWATAQIFDWDPATLVVEAAPSIVRHEELVPVSISTSPSGRTIVDFGQNISGWVRLTVEGEAGTTVTLRHAELLTPAGELETETLRSAAATDRYTLRGGGPETWEPRFTFHGFRYAEVDGWPGGLESEALRAVVVHSEMARTGWFETSNPQITKLHENTVWSMRDNFVGVPTDCPQRDERLGWTGDLNAFTPTATFLYDVRGVLGSWLQDLAAEQRASGTVPWTVPDVLPTPSSATAVWSDAAISIPWALYEEYGDPSILRRSYQSMTSFMAEVEGKLDADGLWSTGFQFGDWLDPDAPSDNPAGGKTDRYLVASAYLCKTTRELASAAVVLGETADAAHYTELSARVRRAFRREFVTETGRVVNESATAYALAIMFGILDGDQLGKAGDRLAELVTASGFTISTGFAGTPLITDALSSTGHLDEAYELLLQTKSPSFLYPVTMGATTIWERWDSVLPDGTLNSTGMTSLNHYALGAVADWLHRVVGGLSRTSPGWQTLTIAPQPGGGLTSASVAHDTVLGRASVDWRVEGGEFVLEAAVPEGATAAVRLPLHPDGDSTLQVGGGSHTWRYALPDGYGEELEYTMDTPMKELMKDDSVWGAVMAVMRTYFPGVPLDAAGAQMAEMSLSMVAGRLPDASDALERDLTAALAAPGAPA